MPGTFSYNPFFLDASGETEAIASIETQLQRHLKANVSGVRMAHMTMALQSRYPGGTQPAPKMYAELAKPFESIESAHEFVALLEESIQEAVGDVRDHLRDAEGASDERQVRALNLALYKLTQLESQMHKSRRALNDLRSIRRLLFTERD
jgi:hypothetical protein